MQIGAQLYSAHNRTKTLEGFAETLEKVAKIGYRSVQVSGTCPYEPEWLRDELQKNGLVCAMTHIAPAKILEDPLKVVQEHAVFGCKHIGIGSLGSYGFTNEGYEAFKKDFIPIAKKIRDAGAKFLYHNHFQEFQGDFAEHNMIDRILEDFPADAVDFTLDLGWAGFAQQDVVALIEKLAGRLSRIHLKDFLDEFPAGIEGSRAYLRPIYEGKLPYDEYIKALAKAGTEYMLVEQDSCYNEDEFECLRRSYVNVTSRFPEAK